MTTTDTDALTERIARILNDEGWTFEGVHEPGDYDGCEDCRLAVDPIAARIAREVAVEVRKAKAEAFDSFCNALADHLDLGTPRAWGFRHPCDPPGVRWEPTERDRALMDVADLVRNDTLNPYRETGDSDEHR